MYSNKSYNHMMNYMQPLSKYLLSIYYTWDILLNFYLVLQTT